MGLREYFRKRSFSKTPEPEGRASTSKTKPRAGGKLRFVVQEHHATALHYDFRLEMDGVLKSWAIPKGPSLDPHEHHLAIQTEDHPFEYRTFEGVIPEGNYGAGNVIIWDEGTYEPRAQGPGIVVPKDAKGAGDMLRAELKKGHLTFMLHGTKLKGEFALIHMPHSKEDNAWLLIKKGDQYASHRDITKDDESVKSHQRVDDLGAHGKLPDLGEYPRKAVPWRVEPMLCTLVDEPFDRDGWLFEIKWDGYRAIATRHGDDYELYSRNHLDFRDKFPPVAEALHDLKHNVILDGEIVATDAEGKPHFEWLQSWHRQPQGNLQYYVFDILWCDGHDVRTMPLSARKTLLKSLLPKSQVLRFGEDVADEGIKLFKQIAARGLEGIVAKQADSPYREADRGAAWLKIKTHLRQEVVIGGYTEPRGGRKYLGSLLVGVYDHGSLVFVGHSGGGIPDDQRKILQERLTKIERATSPFITEPKPNAPVHWVKPVLVGEMSFSEWTSDGSMRHPSFMGLRPDKTATDVHRETSKVVRTEKAEHATTQNAPKPFAAVDLPFEITHPDKVFFPGPKYTKGDLCKYYESVAEYILPYLKDRPLSLNRMPNGITGESFFQKNHEHLPSWAPHADIFSDSNKENLRWIVGGELNVLLYIVQLGSIEINPWNSRTGHLENPDWCVIDLDPEGISFEKVIEVAHAVHTVCEEWKVPAVPKTSGKTGLHIYIPLGAKYSHEQSKTLAHLIVLEVNKRLPKITSVERMPEKRHHKIYLDFLQNREGQTLAAPYSVRPTPQATVSMPLHWDEVKPGLKPTDFTIKNTAARLKRTGDLWKPVLGPGVHVGRLLKYIESLGGKNNEE